VIKEACGLNSQGGKADAMARTALVTAITLLLLSTPRGSAADSSRLLRWVPPPDPDVAGYNLYLSTDCRYSWNRLDIGFRVAGPSGVASFMLAPIDEGYDYYVMMTAYNADGCESAFSNEICFRITEEGTNACAPWVNACPVQSLTEIVLEMHRLEDTLDDVIPALGPEAGGRLMSKLERLQRAIDRARVSFNADERSIRKALKRYGKVTRMLDLVRRRGADPREVSAAEDTVLDVLRRVAQREVAGVYCGGDDRCIEGMTKLQEEIWKGDAKRSGGRKASAGGSYVKAYRNASKH
jgi:hypothetical protein